MFYRFIGLGLLIIWLGIGSCAKDAQILPTDYPYINSVSIGKPDTNGIEMTAEIIHLGNDSILDYGFVWSSATTEPTIVDYRLSFPGRPTGRWMKSKITNCICKNFDNWIRPYIHSRKYLVYGESRSFIGLGNLAFSIFNFMPKSGKIGSQLTITGDNFNSNQIACKVYFGDTKAKIISVNSSNITVEVPNIQTNEKISIWQINQVLHFNDPFTIVLP